MCCELHSDVARLLLLRNFRVVGYCWMVRKFSVVGWNFMLKGIKRCESFVLRTFCCVGLIWCCEISSVAQVLCFSEMLLDAEKKMCCKLHSDVASYLCCGSFMLWVFFFFWMLRKFSDASWNWEASSVAKVLCCEIVLDVEEILFCGFISNIEKHLVLRELHLVRFWIWRNVVSRVQFWCCEISSVISWCDRGVRSYRN